MKKRLNFFVKLAILAVIIVAVTILIKMNMSLNDLESEISLLEAEKKAQDIYIEELTEDIAAPFGDSVIKRIAREKFGYYEKGIILISNDIPN